ncbi:MAG TPA: ABC transporter substrate binding protein [Candidatus Eisenbacteria bacterium]|nr:ABC transporter substrate binding protein [Candidatus Eisenbacteria bacterium]
MKPGRARTWALPRREWALRATLLAAWMACAAPAFGGTVVVLRSRALAPYDSAIAGFEAAYRNPVTRFTLADTGGAALRDRIASLRPDAIVAMGLRGALFAREHFPRTPLVYCIVQDPARHDLGGVWVTGVSSDVPPAVELTSLRAAAPDVRRLAVFYSQTAGAAFAREARKAAADLGIQLVEVAIADLSELAGRAREAARRADALWMPADPMIAAPEPFRFLLDLSLETRKPLFTFSDALVRAGALAAVVPDYQAAGAQAAESVRRIQAGERAGDIPASTVRRTRLVVNGSTARALGRDLPVAARRGAEVLP